MHGEFRYCRTEDDRSVGYVWDWMDVAKQRCSAHHHVVWDWQNVGCESRGCSRVATRRDRWEAPCMLHSHELPFDGTSEDAVQLIRQVAC